MPRRALRRSELRPEVNPRLQQLQLRRARRNRLRVSSLRFQLTLRRRRDQSSQVARHRRSVNPSPTIVMLRC
jgi:hypothetical protein